MTRTINNSKLYIHQTKFTVTVKIKLKCGYTIKVGHTNLKHIHAHTKKN